MFIIIDSEIEIKGIIIWVGVMLGSGAVYGRQNGKQELGLARKYPIFHYTNIAILLTDTNQKLILWEPKTAN